MNLWEFYGSFTGVCVASGFVLHRKASVFIGDFRNRLYGVNVGGSTATDTLHYLYHVVVYARRFAMAYTWFSFEGVAMKLL